MPSQVADVDFKESTAGDVLLKPRGDHVAVSTANGDGVSSRMLGEDEIPTGMLETVAERRARRRSHYVVYFTTFVMSIGFSIVLTGVWPYLQQLDPSVSKEYLGWVVAANPLGQMLASPAFGLWANKAGSNRGAFIATIFFFVVGNALYAVLSAFGYAARAVMIFSRFVVGVSSANVAIIRSYVAASTTMSERTIALSLISAAQGLGFIFGPAIQAAIAVGFNREERESANSTLNETLEYELTNEGPRVEWDMYTAAGWFAALLGFFNIFLYLPCIYQEHPIAAKEARLQKRVANGSDFKLPKPDYLMLFVILIAFFVILTLYVLIETLMVPMTMDLYAWNDQKAITIIGIGLSIAGLLTVIMFGSVGILSKKVDERKILIFLGLLPLLLSTICFFPMGSTYPKMQNCTVETQPENSDFVDFTTISPNNSKATTLLPDEFADAVKSFENLPIEIGNASANVNLNTESPDYSTIENVNSIDSPYTLDPLKQNDSHHATISRRRRHIARNGVCRDLGCPLEQTWCYYTPIIEIPQLAVACFVAVVGYPVAFALLSAFFSKLLGPKPQGVWMGILTSAGSFSRVVGPIFVSYLYTTLGTRWTFGILFCVLAITNVLIALFFKRLVPMRIMES